MGVLKEYELPPESDPERRAFALEHPLKYRKHRWMTEKISWVQNIYSIFHVLIQRAQYVKLVNEWNKEVFEIERRPMGHEAMVSQELLDFTLNRYFPHGLNLD